MKRLAWLFLLAAFCCNGALADPFLEPQVLPDNLNQLNFEDSKTGDVIRVRLDENHLPVTQDFFAEGVSIPFFIEGFLIESASGNQLHAWQVVPRQDPNGVSVLFFHGNAGNILSNLGAGIALVKKGFKVTIVDYSGYGYSTGDASRDNVLADAQSALELFFPMAQEVNEKLVLYGQSLGGHLAVVIAARNQEKIDGLVIEGAFSSHKAIAATHKGALGRIFVSEPYSAEESIGDYTKPILVIHSRDDEIVPFSMGEQLFEAANEPKSFYPIDQAHLAGLSLYADEIAEKIILMLDE